MKPTELLPTSPRPTREQQFRDIATSGEESAACAASDAFKEFPAEEVL